MSIPLPGRTGVRLTVSILAALASFQVHAVDRAVPGHYRTIQQAIDASSAGDTIRIAEGVYAEQLSIGKSIRLVGAGAGRTIVRAPHRLRTGIGGRNSIVEISQGARSSLSFLSVRGPGKGTCDDTALFAGIYVIQGAHLDLDRAQVAEIHDSPAAPCLRSGVGIQVGDAQSGSTGTARVTRSSVTHYQTGGILVSNSGSRAEILDNVVTGPGHSAALVTDGIEFLLGAQGTIGRNLVSGNVCGAPQLGCGNDLFRSFRASGIGAGAAGTKIFENVVYGNQVGIDVSEAVELDSNLLLSNDLLGIALQDGSFRVSGGLILGGVGGVAAIAAFTDTRAVLDGVRIADTEGPAVRKLECCGFHASVRHRDN